jgi:hypothetical protein
LKADDGNKCAASAFGQLILKQRKAMLTLFIEKIKILQEYSNAKRL